MDFAACVYTLEQGDDDVKTYYTKLTTLAERARGTPWEFPESLLKDVFIHKLRDERCRLMVNYKNPVTLQEAATLAMKWEQCMRVCYGEKKSNGFKKDQAFWSVQPTVQRSSNIEKLHKAGVPYDLATELTDLQEDVECALFLAPLPSCKLDANTEWKKQIKKRQAGDTIMLHMNWAKFGLLPNINTKPNGTLVSWRFKAPTIFRHLAKHMNHVTFPGFPQ
eukprot:Protomagalhaensia_wolfi_Nauph_80__1407@NODE_1842_length_1312_cov_195_294580_g1440_i0_p1_GENE_NODE_1842_length_1312_cov_195_294580_g1440_i0NODE_1842_length_1312_cov_195_294580_g1440_i0_p1_ORF_typecomplete_len221_score39_09Retrotrans_gag/PF03732_17/0_0026Retrotran_gag_2/PF14223_6/0_044_NODE_1842_length_1312_cov_195_294580_g1440_i04601122